MAHSYTDELGAIAKEAGKAKTVSRIGKALAGVKGYHQKGIGQLEMARQGGTFAKAKKGVTPEWLEIGAKQRAALAGKGAARFAPHAAVAGAAGYGAHRALKKESEPEVDLMEAMAIDRANNFLAGYIDNAGNPLADAVEEVKVATPQVNEYVDALAVQLLVDNGYGELLNTEG